MKTRYEPNETTIDVIERLEAEIERLRAELASRGLRCSCQIADYISDECARLGKCKERFAGRFRREGGPAMHKYVVSRCVSEITPQYKLV